MKNNVFCSKIVLLSKVEKKLFFHIFIQRLSHFGSNRYAPFGKIFVFSSEWFLLKGYRSQIFNANCVTNCQKGNVFEWNNSEMYSILFTDRWI